MFQTPRIGLLIVLLFTACEEGEEGEEGGQNVARQGSGSCLEEHDTYAECITFYGGLDQQDDESWCEEHGGEWSDGACPSGFDASCDLEILDDIGLEAYFYDMSEEALDSNELMCDTAGGIWYE